MELTEHPQGSYTLHCFPNIGKIVHVKLLMQLPSSHFIILLVFEILFGWRMFFCPCRAHQPNEAFINQFNVLVQPLAAGRTAETDDSKDKW